MGAGGVRGGSGQGAVGQMGGGQASEASRLVRQSAWSPQARRMQHGLAAPPACVRTLGCTGLWRGTAGGAAGAVPVVALVLLPLSTSASGSGSAAAFTKLPLEARFPSFWPKRCRAGRGGVGADGSTGGRRWVGSARRRAPPLYRCFWHDTRRRPREASQACAHLDSPHHGPLAALAAVCTGHQVPAGGGGPRRGWVVLEAEAHSRVCRPCGRRTRPAAAPRAPPQSPCRRRRGSPAGSPGEAALGRRRGGGPPRARAAARRRWRRIIAAEEVHLHPGARVQLCHKGHRRVLREGGAGAGWSAAGARLAVELRAVRVLSPASLWTTQLGRY